MQITIPPLPGAEGWRKAVQGLDPEQTGGWAVHGHMLNPGDVVDAPAGTLVLAVDKEFDGTKWSATTTIHLADSEGLREVWRRKYSSAKAAVGPTTLKQLAKLLEDHPTPDGQITVLHQAPKLRANKYGGSCHECGGWIAAGAGVFVGHGKDGHVEHAGDCPPPAQRQAAPKRRSSKQCDECDRRGATHHRTDSSGIGGIVCDSCNREPRHCLSFA
jgi:hypothetical protein